MRVKLTQVGEDLVFTGLGDTGHYVMMDTTADFGGTAGASKPKELLLMALGGCTGMDVDSILKKMKVPVVDRLLMRRAVSLWARNVKQ